MWKFPTFFSKKLELAAIEKIIAFVRIEPGSGQI